jgi:hypothetical protein
MLEHIGAGDFMKTVLKVLRTLLIGYANKHEYLKQPIVQGLDSSSPLPAQKT